MKKSPKNLIKRTITRLTAEGELVTVESYVPKKQYRQWTQYRSESPHNSRLVPNYRLKREHAPFKNIKNPTVAKHRF